METVLEFSAWMAGVFIVIKIVFKYLAWLYHDKDKTLRENVERAGDYVSEHSYFDVMKRALARLYERLGGIFQKKIRFLYLFLLFLLLNSVSLLLARYWIGIDLAEARHTLLTLRNLITPWKQVPGLYGWTNSIGFGTALTSLFQLSLLDLCSFTFTVGIIRSASRSKTTIQFLLEVLSDLLMLGLFFVVVFQCFYYWLMKDISVSLLGSFLLVFLTTGLILALSLLLKGAWRLSSQGINHHDPFTPLLHVLALGFIASVFLGLAGLLRIYSLDPVRSLSVFAILSFVPSLPLFVLYYFRFFRPLPRNKVLFTLRLVSAILVISLVGYVSVAAIDYYGELPKVYSVISSALSSNFVLLLVFSSAFPTLAHLIAITPAIIAKATPKRLEQFINRHLYALSGNEERILSQLGNAFGVIGALITAFIKLI